MINFVSTSIKRKIVQDDMRCREVFEFVESNAARNRDEHSAHDVISRKVVAAVKAFHAPGGDKQTDQK